jgi:hypothetical protein
MRRPRRSLAVLALALAVVAFPLGALASHDFGDVPDSNLFHADISALVNAGVTSGCGGGNYCPSANVTREQMAAFLNRLGALAPGKTPVVNADRLDGLDSTDFLLGEQIETTQMGPWFTSSGAATVQHLFDRERISASGSSTSTVSMRIHAPAEIDGHFYGLNAMQICWLDGATNVVIGSVTVFDVTTALTSVLSEGADVDPTGGAGCTVLSASGIPPQVLGGMTVMIQLPFTAAGQIDVTSVLFQWELGAPVN